MARLGPRFGPKIPPEKVYVGPFFLRSFPGNEAHKLFLGAQNWVFWGEGQKVYVEKVYVLFGPLPRVCKWLLASKRRFQILVGISTLPSLSNIN